jgi:DNA-binding LacI/PurR family transcriptional regulator
VADHKPSPTISDVAARAGVSIATVSRVLNGNTPVAAATMERVRSAVEELAFVPRSAARVLASQRTNTIGLVLDEIGRDFFSPLLRGIEAAAREAGYELLIRTTGNPHVSNTFLKSLGQHNTDGLIVFIDSLTPAELARLHRNGFPMVLMHQTPPATLDIPVVTVENKSGAQKIIEHLIQVHGCRRIAFLQGPDGNQDSEWRERGYREALEAHGLAFDPTLVASGGYDERVAQASMEHWLMEGIQIDAIFAGDDESATGVLAALHRAGKRVPEDVAVVGFDDVAVARFLQPPLTTVRAPIEQVGREAARQLLRLIRGEKVEATILLPTELVIRESCGCRAELAQGGDPA